MEFRKEHDALGEVLVPADHKWGAQTERSHKNFKIGERMPMEIIYALAILKKACAKVNFDMGKIDRFKKDAIQETCDEIIKGKWDDEFPLVVYQTGSGTQTNMNGNEVIAHIATQKLHDAGSDKIVHPNDDVNCSQSSNDTFPTAMHIAAVKALHDYLYNPLDELITTFQFRSEKYMHIVKIGRTHLQDAVPLTFGQEMSGWMTLLRRSKSMIKDAEQHLLGLAIGGTAVGTGLNAPKGFGDAAASVVCDQVGLPFYSEENKFYALTGRDSLVFAHGALEALAMDMMKIANDVRMLASGPKAGLGEISIPANEPGSSIMPGKVNPTQCEAVTMVACRVHGNQSVISMAASQGNFELNVFAPVIAATFIESVKLLGQVIDSFNKHCARGIKPIEEKMNELVKRSLMLVTALSPVIGHDNAAKIANKAFEDNITLKEAAVELGFMTAEEYDQYVDPKAMTMVEDDD